MGSKRWLQSWSDLISGVELSGINLGKAFLEYDRRAGDAIKRLLGCGLLLPHYAIFLPTG